MQKNKLKKDIKKRLNVQIGEKKKLLLKFIIYSTALPKKIREKAFNMLLLYINNTRCYKTQINNFCIFSSRGRGVLGSFKISRIVFRRLALSGSLLGIRKSS